MGLHHVRLLSAVESRRHSVKTGPRFTDDNLVAGLALLETVRTTNDPLAKRRYIHAAEREADFLIGSGLWDDTFGGGFWWNTGKGDTEEGKPAQTNALASLFFARLSATTGNTAYRDWALKSQLWLDTILWDPTRQLYRWSVGFTDIPHRTGAKIQNRYFNYDQGIAIESLLAASRLDGDANRVSRAQAIGRATHAAFWSLAPGRLQPGERHRPGLRILRGVDQSRAPGAVRAKTAMPSGSIWRARTRTRCRAGCASPTAGTHIVPISA